jgi:hypothetical protein
MLVLLGIKPKKLKATRFHPLELSGLFKLVMGGVHTAEYIGFIQLIVPLIMKWPGRVNLQGGLLHKDKVFTIASLISERPHEDRRMVLIPMHHPNHSVYHGILPFRFSLRKFVMQSMRFQVALVKHVDPKFIAELVPFRMVWIVARAHSVDVILLE